MSVSCAVRRSAPTGAGTSLVAFADPESMLRLARSHHRVDFFHLANQFEGQSNKVFCGPTTAAIVLNTLRAGDDRIEKPEDRSLLPAGRDLLYRRYTQSNLFNAKTEAVKTHGEVLGQTRVPGVKPDPGLQLRQLHEILRAEGLDSQLRIVDAARSDAVIHEELVDNLGTAGDYVIVNYFRPVVGQAGGGHISPLGAYDEASDSFLILDVNPNGRSWVWVPAPALIGAMRTFDEMENRGYLLVREGTP